MDANTISPRRLVALAATVTRIRNMAREAKANGEHKVARALFAKAKGIEAKAAAMEAGTYEEPAREIKGRTLAALRAHVTMAETAIKGTRGKARQAALEALRAREAALADAQRLAA